MSIQLELDSYCGNCNRFEAETTKAELYSNLEMTICETTITCMNRKKCKEIYEYLKAEEQYREEQGQEPIVVERQKGFEKCSECKYKDSDLCKTRPLHEEDEDGNCIDFVPEEKYTPPMPKEKWRIVKPGWIIVPKCSTCKYLKSPIVPCNRCRDNSEFEPAEQM